MEGDAAVEVEGLRRVFSRKGDAELVALDDVNLTIERGEMFGLLGPNGAGKTTLVKILSTVLLPTGGTARVLGFDVVSQAQQVREHIGLVFGGDQGLYPRLTARQNLEYAAALHHLPRRGAAARADEVLDLVHLRDRSGDRVETFSRGMKQRLHLARGLLTEAPVLFLDEPTVGLDPVASEAFRTLVKELRERGRTILLTTHDMAEAEQLCNRVALIRGGHILVVRPPAAMGRWLAEQAGHEAPIGASLHEVYVGVFGPDGIDA